MACKAYPAHCRLRERIVSSRRHAALTIERLRLHKTDRRQDTKNLSIFLENDFLGLLHQLLKTQHCKFTIF